MPPSASARVADADVARSPVSIVLRFIMTASPEMIQDAPYSAAAAARLLNTALSAAVEATLVQADDEVGAFAGLAWLMPWSEMMIEPPVVSISLTFAMASAGTETRSSASAGLSASPRAWRQRGSRRRRPCGV